MTNAQNISDILEQLKSIAEALGVKTGVIRNEDQKKKVSSGSLTTNQKKEVSEKAKIYSSIFDIKRITTFFEEQKKNSKVLKTTLENLFDIGVENKNHLINSENINKGIKSSLDKYTATNDKTKKESDDKKESPLKKLFTGLAGITGLVALGIGIYNVIKALKEGGTLQVSSILKLVAAVGIFIGLFVFVAKSKASFMAASISFGIFAGIVSFIILPLIKSLELIEWDVLLNSLGKIALVMVGLGAVIFLVGKLAGNVIGTIVALGSLFAMTYLMGYLGTQLQKLAALPWVDVGIGLTAAIATLGIFGLLVAGIGALVSTGAGAIILGAGIASVMALTYAIGYVADTIKKFNEVDGDALISAGKGLSELGLGLVSFMTGMVGGVAGTVLDKIASFFKLDIITSIKKFQDLDGDKLMNVGLGLKYMGEGMKSLSENINLDGVVKQIINLTSPIAMLSNALFNYGKSYSNLSQIIDKSALNKNLSLIVNNDNSIQQAILDMNKQELEVNRQQLFQLEKNGELLKLISERISMVSSGSSNLINASGGVKNDINSPTFNTKNNFMDHIKMATTRLDN